MVDPCKLHFKSSYPIWKQLDSYEASCSEMFGVMTIATIIMIGLAIVFGPRFKANIVQSARGHDPHFLNTAWTIQILRGVLLWFCALGVAAFVFSQTASVGCVG